MKIVEKKTITTITEYIAEDGTVFNSAQNCEEYETEVLQKKAIENIEHLKIEANTPPLSITYLNDEHEFLWYVAHNETDLKEIASAYGISLKNIEMSKYPVTLCIENEYGSYYPYTLEECERITASFWERFGYKINLQENYGDVIKADEE